MIYLSKGVVCKGSAEDKLHIAHGNAVLKLDSTESEIWQNGRFEISEIPETDKYKNVFRSLYNKGLLEYEHGDDDVLRYRLLSKCICCPARTKGLQKPISKNEKYLLKWLAGAGLRLSTAELIYLVENEIKPVSSLLSSENRQSLVETIYTKDNIYDNILETQMEKAKCRDDVVKTLLSLLKKKRIVVL